MAFVMFFFFSVCVSACMSAQGGGRDLLGDIVTLTPGWLLSDALASDPVHCGREGLSLRAAGADKLGLEVILGASGLPGESWSSAESQVSFQQVFLVLTSRVSYTYELVRHFLRIRRDLIWFWFSLAQLIFTLIDMGAAEESGTPTWQRVGQRRARMCQQRL